jgi:DNA-binding NarL/FixJ family response regulator
MGDPLAAPRRTVLIVDDTEYVRRSFGILLRWHGAFDVVGEAASAAEALALAAALHPEIVLLDRWVADGDSLAVVPALRALAPPPQVVLISAASDDAARREAVRLGVALCLDKTTPPEDICAALAQLPLA